MGEMLSYSLSSAIMLAALYQAYRWTMANERQFTINRVTLYIIYMVSLLAVPTYDALPYIDIPTDAPTHTSHISVDLSGATAGIAHPSAPVWATVLVWVYLAGMTVAATRFAFSLIRVALVIRKGETAARMGALRVVTLPDDRTAPFSFCRYIVMSRGDYSHHDRSIITHELTHLRGMHWIDLTVANIMAIFQWYNPAAWLMIEEFKTVHEYQADDAVIAKEGNVKEYQMMLIKKAVGERLPSPANSLNHSKLKKRVTMMYKERPRTLRRVAALATIPALAIGLAVVNIPAVAALIADTDNAALFNSVAAAGEHSSGKVSNFYDNQEAIAAKTMYADALSATASSEEAAPLDDAEDLATPSGNHDTPLAAAVIAPEAAGNAGAPAEAKDKEVYTAVEQMAEYPGGQAELMNFLAKSIKYPDNAYKNGIQGRVIVKFIVSSTGKVEDAYVVKGVNPELDKEALRVVMSMPDWTPGKVNGKPVDSWFNLPITFKITSDEPKDSVK